MSDLVIATVVFGCSFGAALVGMALHVRLPVDDLDPNSRDVFKLVMGLIATLSALVLSLLLASANTAYDRQRSELQALAANIVLLDRTLEFCGPEASAVRNGLREVVQRTHDRIWSPQGVRPEDLDSEATRNAVRVLVRDVHTLSPSTEVERMLQGHAIQASESMAQARLLMFAQLAGAIS